MGRGRPEGPAFPLGRMLAHVPAAIAGEDPEAVHDMRVAARRVRAAWRVFGDAYERAVVRDRVRELRTLGGRLGAVRDLDVQLAICRPTGTVARSASGRP